jgi:hypothetical protein
MEWKNFPSEEISKLTEPEVYKPFIIIIIIIIIIISIIIIIIIITSTP